MINPDIHDAEWGCNEEIFSTKTVTLNESRRKTKAFNIAFCLLFVIVVCVLTLDVYLESSNKALQVMDEILQVKQANIFNTTSDIKDFFFFFNLTANN